MLIGFKGQFKFKQFNASKPEKYHIKSFGLVDSMTGYVVNILMYFGSQTSYSSRMKDDDKQAIKVFDTLLPVIGTGYHVFFDRLYMTRYVINWMTDHQLYLTGTVNVNRVGFPSCLRLQGR